MCICGVLLYCVSTDVHVCLIVLSCSVLFSAHHQEGIIPHLQRLIGEESHLRQFALPIICDLAHTSATARAELWKNNGVVLYINLLQEKYWQTFALNSLAVWYVCLSANL